MGAMFRGLAVALITGCLVHGGQAVAERAPTVLVEVAATVGDQVIFDSEVRFRLRASGKKVTAQGWTAALAEMVDELLWVRESKRLGIQISDREVDEAIDTVIKQNNLSLLEFEKQLESVGYDMATYRRDVIRQLQELKARFRIGDDGAQKKWLEQARKRAQIDIRRAKP
ncbi:MAG: SurA N-terminal domain-containing protein [Deltaproteobacteria bacterium]|nr:SurA N-terminal domain-containing protein [Deltaproteobacteria bacterium]